MLILGYSTAFSQSKSSGFNLNQVFFSLNEGIIDKKVLLFDGTYITYDVSKDIEFYNYGFDKSDSVKKLPIPISADKLNRELLAKQNPKLAEDTTNTFMNVDPITGDPLVYSKERLKAFYLSWKKEFFVDKKTVREIENDSSSLVVFTDKLLGRNIYIGMYVQIKFNKIQIVLRDLGKVRTKANPNDLEVYSFFCYHIPELVKLNDRSKIRDIMEFKNRMEFVSQNLMDYILNEGDFLERVLDNQLHDYNPKFNF